MIIYILIYISFLSRTGRMRENERLLPSHMAQTSNQFRISQQDTGKKGQNEVSARQTRVAQFYLVHFKRYICTIEIIDIECVLGHESYLQFFSKVPL